MGYFHQFTLLFFFCKHPNHPPTPPPAPASPTPPSPLHPRAAGAVGGGGLGGVAAAAVRQVGVGDAVPALARNAAGGVPRAVGGVGPLSSVFELEIS